MFYPMLLVTILQQQQEITTPIAEEQNYSRTINPE